MIIFPLARLLQKDVSLSGKKSAKRVLKTLTEAIVLAQPKPRREYIVYSGTSYNGLGCVLIQDEKVVVYASRQLKPHERNYPYTRFRVGSSSIYRHYRYKEKCHIVIDKKSLKYFLTQKELNFRQRRWIKLLEDYDYIIDYHMGKANDGINGLVSINAHLKLEQNRVLIVELKVK
ncbi:CCHC-type integrase [Gossypium australe]|uniref:CCHC-type integrase n=1 Tax=Gossypium australe TaxID=47621 RepID=A0A5B6W8L2_9ROSI|nr:CCHC-type integrase [Gossypium australe]